LANIAQQLVLNHPWGPWIWAGIHRRLYADSRIGNSAEHATEILDSMRSVQHWQSLVDMASVCPLPTTSEILSEIKTPVHVIMGEKDPCWINPAAEAVAMVGAPGRAALIVAGAGHFPSVETPDLTNRAVVVFAQHMFASN
jgi:pimeloyl-ACP methyl ester carboxylesterase